ncbi:MAG TPA: vWA domain-containing protein, partial [Phycisphaerales bacterium]|nr:vWA domain-containing protein [Phycisphaerales bacterium]
MGDWIARALSGGSPGLDPDSPLVRFEFAHPLEVWHWAVVVGGAVLLGWWSYSRLEGSRWVRTAAGAVRAAVLLMLVVLLCGPRLVEVKENVERDWVLVLIDRSASMGIVDAPGGGASLRTREAQMRAVLEKASPAFAKMTAERTVKWLGFDAGAYDLPMAGGTRPLLEDPRGRRTDLGAAIEAALAKGAARPIAGIVVLSDGRTTGGSALPRTLVKRLAS